LAHPVTLGIVGLGRWARVLARAAAKSDKLRIAAAYSRTAEKRAAFTREFGIRAVDDFAAMLADPDIRGVILTVPNEQHWPVAEAAAKAGKHVYTEKPIANTLEDGLRMAALEQRYRVRVVVGHSARLLKGTRLMRQAIDAGELGTVSYIEGNFSNDRALELTPQMFRWYRDKTPGGCLSQLAIHQFDALAYLGGEVTEACSMAAKLSPVGAEVDDQSLTLLRFASGALGCVGSSWTSPGVYDQRVMGSKALMHYQIDFGTWDTPSRLHETSTLYIQRRGKGYAAREPLALPAGDMFVEELEMFAHSIDSGAPCELSAANGNAALALVYAALQSIENRGGYVRVADVLAAARANL